MFSIRILVIGHIRNGKVADGKGTILKASNGQRWVCHVVVHQAEIAFTTYDGFQTFLCSDLSLIGVICRRSQRNTAIVEVCYIISKELSDKVYASSFAIYNLHIKFGRIVIVFNRKVYESTFNGIGSFPSKSLLFLWWALLLCQTIHIVLQSTTLNLRADRILADVHRRKRHCILSHNVELNITFVTTTVGIPQANSVFGIKEDAIKRNSQLNTIKLCCQLKGIKITQNKAKVVCLVVVIGSSEGHIPFEGEGWTFHSVPGALTCCIVPITADVSNFNVLSLYQSQLGISKLYNNSSNTEILIHWYQGEIWHGNGLCLSIVSILNIVVHAVSSIRIHAIAITHIQATPRIALVRVSNIQYTLRSVYAIDFLCTRRTSQSLNFTIINVAWTFCDNYIAIVREVLCIRLADTGNLHVSCKLVLTKQIGYWSYISPSWHSQREGCNECKNTL